MWDAHSDVGVAQVRVTGGIVLAVYEDNLSSVGLTIAVIILQGTGVIPLLLVLVGLLRIIQVLDFPKDALYPKAIIATRVFFLAGIAILVAGSCLLGNYKSPGDTTTGIKLVRAGYVLIAAVLGILVMFGAHIWTRRTLLSASGAKCLGGMLASIPFLAVRISYACLSAFNGTPKWNPLVGSVAALVCMHSVMEYIVVVIVLAIGFAISPVNTSPPLSFQDEEHANVARA
ncbi:hypothetical protein M8818_002858 [Zalaria obscura]|uniref:Uncharacterized protein n=1 Tax=Zalaria obscura TaxID=2024903 RepID=A0ACC3SHP4_9PEZI